MKKFLSLLIALVLALCCPVMAMADETITVGASVTPHAEILEIAKTLLADEGYTLDIIEYMDYVLPNVAVESGELDANFFQHTPYLNQYNEENGSHLVPVATVHYEPFGLYAGKSASLADIKDGAIIAVPNDVTNEARALLLLEAQGLIKLTEGVGLNATKIDVVENPHNIDITEIESAQLVRALPDVDYAVINGNYAIEGGLSVADALAIEEATSEAAVTYANVLVVKAGNEEDAGVQALVKALLSDEVRDFINNTYNGAVVPMF